MGDTMTNDSWVWEVYYQVMRREGMTCDMAFKQKANTLREEFRLW